MYGISYVGTMFVLWLCLLIEQNFLNKSTFSFASPILYFNIINVEYFHIIIHTQE